MGGRVGVGVESCAAVVGHGGRHAAPGPGPLESISRGGSGFRRPKGFEDTQPPAFSPLSSMNVRINGERVPGRGERGPWGALDQQLIETLHRGEGCPW